VNGAGTKMSGGFAAFVDDIEALRRDVTAEHELVKRVADRLADFNRSERWLPADFRVPCMEKYVQHVVYVSPDSGFSICSLVWCEQQATPIHDHCAWCVVGVYEGAENETRFRVEGDGDARRLVPIGTTQMVAGDAAGFAADGNDVHRVTNPTQGVAISIHVYGADIRTLGSSIRNRFDDLPIVARHATA
jgi:predicted metal-dependent enzyme (double-stranded beta helix superfamily)